MQRSAYCVCSLTFHARCWPGDVPSRAPLWCQDRRSLHRRSNNGCSKTQQVSSAINFRESNASASPINYTQNSLDSQINSQVNVANALLFFFNVLRLNRLQRQTLIRARVSIAASLIFIIVARHIRSLSRNLFRNLYLENLFRYLLSARSLRSFPLRRRVDCRGTDHTGRCEFAARWLRLAATTVGRIFPLF